MKTLEFATCLIIVTAAQELEWNVRVRNDTWEACETDSDCFSWNSCIPHMWKENANYSASKGCRTPAFCQGTSTWNHGEKYLQFFCNEEQIAKGASTDLDPPMTWWSPHETKIWDEFKEACGNSNPCQGRNRCLSEREVYIWENIDTEWSVGHGCYDWETFPCDDGFALTIDDEIADSYYYWEAQCDLDFPNEIFRVSTSDDAMKSASVAMASLIALSSTLF